MDYWYVLQLHTINQGNFVTDLSNSGHQCTTTIGYYCGNVQSFNYKSYLWSIKKKTWLSGPKVGDFSFENACGVSLNSTSVLFIGAAKGPYFILKDNVETLIYNFDLKKWSQQQSLPRSFLGFKIEWAYKMACGIHHDKNSSRYVDDFSQIHKPINQKTFIHSILAMSFAREPGILDYQMFGWTSDLNHIFWHSLDIVHNIRGPGILSTLNGNLHL